MKESDNVRKEGLLDGGETTVTLELDDGKELECVVLKIFRAGEHEYIAVTPQDTDEDGEVYLYRFVETPDGQPDLTNIEDDDEYEIAADRFDEILDEQEFEELFPGRERS